jgi:pimeloyl-ACP methyl ester carboxylesterase
MSIKLRISTCYIWMRSCYTQVKASDPSQPRYIFEKIPRLCKNVKLKWVTGASHFSNLDQPEQVAEGINLLLRSVEG